MGEGPIKAAQLRIIDKHQNDLHNNLVKSLCAAFFRKRVPFQLNFIFNQNPPSELDFQPHQ